MRFEEIKSAVPAPVAGQLEALHARFLEEEDDASLDAFIEWLHAHGHISADDFGNLHTLGSVVLTRFGSLSTWTGEDDATEEVTVSATRLAGGDRFEFLGLLAEGNMGEVHVARDRDLQRKVAVKRMHTKMVAKPNLASRFFVEAQVTAQLDHPNIVPVYSLERAPDGRLAYSMKLVRGRTFHQLCADARHHVDRGADLPDELALSQRLEWFLKACDAISYAHSRGVVHRDLKPENVMVGTFGEVYVMDWGVARVLDQIGVPEADLGRLEVATANIGRTQLGTVIGTPAYMSPEQADGDNESLDGRSDEFSLGLILYELVCLRPAIETGTAVQVLLRISRGELQPLEPYGPERRVEPALGAIIRRACAVEPDDRYPSVKAMADDVRRFQRNLEVQALPDNLLQRVNRWAFHHQRTVALALGLLLASSATGAISSLVRQNQAVHRAAEREEALGAMLTAAGAHAHVVDGRLARHEGHLEALAGSAVEALSRPAEWVGPEGNSFFLGDPFAPPDLVASERYDRKVSVGWPVVRLAEGTRLDQVLPEVQQLTLLRQPLRRLLLVSASFDAVGSGPAAERQLLLEEGAPVAWAHVALPSGVYVGYPGHGGLPPGFDARRTPWYERAQDGPRGPMWGHPLRDPGGMGLMLPCAMGMYGDDGQLIGVAGIEISLDDLIDHLRGDERLSGFSEVYLVEGEGRVVVRSSERGRGRVATFGTTKAVRMKRFPNDRVRRALRERDAGHLLVQTEEGPMLYVYYRMNSVGWHYVLRGSAQDMLPGP